ncbi:hypothetical protein R3W88_026858 [Solanum pinnatisectum]|uniref:Uncharacterized protein n=1 Tax=Solanum pinnatisectum TaxID=50273 RepID=A0AAV9LFD5_9SOLN|nr:hypothetical protein R3W88_026858 [Solanum pinnatisectum]
MTKINHAWYTREDQLSPLTLRLKKEQLEKNQERDENMAKMMTQMMLLTKHVMGGGYKDASLDDAKFETMYDEKVHFLLKEAWGSCSSYLKLGRNQGWNIDHEDGWRDRDWRDRDPYWKSEDDDNDRYEHTYNRPKSKKLFNVPKSFQTKVMFACILNKVEGLKEVLKEIKVDFSSLNKMVTSHLASIKQF